MILSYNLVKRNIQSLIGCELAMPVEKYKKILRKV